MESASTSETSCTAILDPAPGSTSPSSVLRSTWLRGSKPSPRNWEDRCCCPARSPTWSKAISISNASANIRSEASIIRSSCLHIMADAELSRGQLHEHPRRRNTGVRTELERVGHTYWASARVASPLCPVLHGFVEVLQRRVL